MVDISCATWDTEEDKRLSDEWAEKHAGNGYMPSPEIAEEIERIAPELESTKEDFERAIEETRRKEFAEEQWEREEKNLEYKKRLQESIKVKVSDEHSLLIKGFNVSRINNEDRARIQSLLPPIVSQVSEEMIYTGEFPYSRMTERGEIEIVLEKWSQRDGKAVGEFYKHPSELFFGKREEELTLEEQEELQRIEMETQLHWNFHTIYNILFTDEDRVEIEQICYEAFKNNPEWVKAISKYAAEMAEVERYDEVFCECGVKFITQPTMLKKVNRQMYEFIGDRLARLSRLSDFLGLETKILK